MLHFYDEDFQEQTINFGNEEVFAQGAYALRKRGVNFTAWEVIVTDEVTLREVVP